MDHRIVDLHVRSTESDGTFTPEDLVAEAKKAGLAAFALTDHDTCQGVGKAMPCAASAGIELIPGIELSTDYHGKEVHIVGLYIDIENEQLLRKTAEYRKCSGIGLFITVWNSIWNSFCKKWLCRTNLHQTKTE